MSSTQAYATDRTVYRTTAWSTRVDLMVTEPTSMVAAASILHEELDRIDRVTSRFRSDSELTALNEAAGTETAVTVSADLIEAIIVALRAASLSNGAVDPTVGKAMCLIGYDRDIDQIYPGVPGRPPEPSPIPGWRSVEVDADRSTVRLTGGTLLDLGATSKAFAADRAARDITARLGCGALVSLGGDIAISGVPTVRFDVGISEVPDDEPCPMAVTLGPGGLATSGTGARRWLLGDRSVHHLIDPTTGLSVETCWSTVSVAARSCVDANTASTASMIKGTDAVGWLESLGLPARLVRSDGSVVTVAGWPTESDGSAPVDLSQGQP